MADNRNSDAAWNYHNATKHSYASIRTNTHLMDWSNQPLPFKIYPTLEPMRLPGEVRQSGVAGLSAIAERVSAQTRAAPDLEAVAQLLYLSAGITRRRKYSGGEIYFRAAACTGALYEVELYLVCGELGGLEAGVYHFSPAEFGLRKLRAGDYRGALVAATGGEAAIAHAPLTIICTCTYWRNAWKYQARTYRHFGWDNGTLLSNLLAVATVCRREWCVASWTRRSIACWMLIPSVKWRSLSWRWATSRLFRRRLLRKFHRFDLKPCRSLSARWIIR